MDTGITARGEPAQTDAPVARRSSVFWPRCAFVLGTLVVAFGLGIRIWSLGRQAINADQAVVALMAQQILHGHFSAFYWGQNYGGGEPYVVAIVFALFGQSTFTLGLAPILLDVLAAVLVWRLGRRLFTPTIGIEAALLFWLWPEVFIWQSTIEYGFRWFVLDLGLMSWLLALRVIEGTRHRYVELCIMALALGAGWWGSPEIMYFFLPLALYGVYCAVEGHLRFSLREVTSMVLAAAIGASPWIEANVRSHLSSLHSGIQPDPGMVHHLKIFLEHSLPLVLGLQLRVSGRWLVGAVVGNALEYLALALGVALLVMLIRRRQAIMLVAFCILAPFIYAFSPFTWYWADGRYAVYLAPAAAMLVVVGAHELVHLRALDRLALGRRSGWTVAIAMAACFGLTLGAMSQTSPYKPNGVVQTGSESWTSWTLNPDAGFANVAHALISRGVRDVYAGYWVAYPLMFESKGGLIASDISYVRSPAILRTLEDYRKTAWLFVEPKHNGLAVAYTGVSVMDPSCASKTDRCLYEPNLIRYLRHRHIGYRIVNAMPFAAVIPDRPISPEAITKQYGLREVYSLNDKTS